MRKWIAILALILAIAGVTDAYAGGCLGGVCGIGRNPGAARSFMRTGVVRRVFSGLRFGRRR